MTILNVSRVSAYYNSSHKEDKVLDNISLQMKSNALTVILGPSGCGKTTLLNLIAGFNMPTEGKIEFNGQQVTGPSVERGVIFQQDALLPWLNVINNVAFGLKLNGVRRSEREETARKILKLVDLLEFENHYIWELSGGMKQRVGLARALASDPKILLMDEPLGALDAFTREQMQELLLQIWQKTHKQILFITHDIEEAVFLATELILMTPYPGKIAKKLSLDFGSRYCAGEPVRQIKSDSSFIDTREQVLEWFFKQKSSVQKQEGILFEKDFIGAHTKQATKTKQLLMPAIPPSLPSLHRPKGGRRTIQTMAKYNSEKPAFIHRRKRYLKTNVHSKFGDTQSLFSCDEIKLNTDNSSLEEELQLIGISETKSTLVKKPISPSHRTISFFTLLFLVLIWELITCFEWIQPLYLPSPLSVLVKLWDVSSVGYLDASLWQHLSASLGRIGLALFFAVIVGVPVGLAIGLNALAKAILDPLIEFYRPIPPLAYLPLIVIWFGIGEFSKVLLIYLAIFAPIVLSTASGVRKVDVVKIQVSQSLGGTYWQIIRFVVIPSVLPNILTGIRIGLGAGWSTLVAAELVAATYGLGSMIQAASQFLMTDIVIAGILVISLVAYLLEFCLRRLEKKLVPWQD